jgi:hypothetical protein
MAHGRLTVDKPELSDGAQIVVRQFHKGHD